MIAQVGLVALVAVAAPTPLDGAWRFTAGDPPGAADPGFDDSAWVTMDLPGRWVGTPFEDHRGYAWYRRRVHIEGPASTALLLPPVNQASEIFVDGVKVGAYGRMPPEHWPEPLTLRVMPWPEGLRDAVIAVRTHRFEGFSTPGGTRAEKRAPAAVGSDVEIERLRAAVLDARLRDPENARSLLVAGLYLGAAFLFLTLWFLGRRDPAAFWVALLLFNGGASLLLWFVVWTGVLSDAWIGLVVFSTALFEPLLVVVSAILFRPPRRWVRVAGALMAAVFVALVVRSLRLALLTSGNWILVANTALALTFFLAAGVRGALRGHPDARPLLAGVGVGMGTVALGFGYIALAQRRPPVWLEWSLNLLSYLAVFAAFGFVLVRRYTRSTEDLIRSRTGAQRFVPQDFLQILGRREVDELERGDAAEAERTVLFADVRGFTRASEGRSAAETFDWLNRYFAVVEPPIRAHGGFVNQYYGDGIMAVFTEPGAAVDAAVEMQDALQSSGLGAHVGIGVHTGPLLVGAIGGPTRLDTGVVGDVVNVAARIEAATKRHGQPILVSEAVRVGAPGRSFVKVAEARLEGRDAPIALYAPT